MFDLYESIITEIKSNLTDDNEYNREYLINQIHKYEKHEFSKEMIRELSKLLWDYLSNDEREKYIDITNQEPPITSILHEVSIDMNNRDFEKALNKLDYFLVNGNLNFYENDTTTEYHHFTNPLEEILFHETGFAN